MSYTSWPLSVISSFFHSRSTQWVSHPIRDFSGGVSLHSLLLAALCSVRLSPDNWLKARLSRAGFHGGSFYTPSYCKYPFSFVSPFLCISHPAQHLTPQTLGTFTHTQYLYLCTCTSPFSHKPLSSPPGLLLFSPCHNLAPLSMGDQCGYAALGSAEA